MSLPAKQRRNLREIVADRHGPHSTLVNLVEKLLQMGTIGLEGTKIHANASRHSALSHASASFRCAGWTRCAASGAS